MKSWSEYLADETEKKETRVSRERERQLAEHKKQTNADRIRAMSDEELADFLEEFEVCTYCKYCDKERCTFENPCTHEFAGVIAYEWLKSEVKE